MKDKCYVERVLYCVQINLDRFIEFCDTERARLDCLDSDYTPLGVAIINVAGVFDPLYDKHYGNGVFFNIYGQYDTAENWKEIEQVFKDYDLYDYIEKETSDD